jgi:predicted RND superfamily exporter protein
MTRSQNFVQVNVKKNGEKSSTTSGTFRKRLSRYLRGYCRLLVKPAFRVFVFTFTAIFFVVSLWGTLRIRTHINSQKIIPSDSHLLQADNLMQRYIWRVSVSLLKLKSFFV